MSHYCGVVVFGFQSCPCPASLWRVGTRRKRLRCVFLCVNNRNNYASAASSSSHIRRECLIIGLGNPGTELSNTRHNLGFQVLDYYANRYSFTFKKDKYLHAEYACREYVIQYNNNDDDNKDRNSGQPHSTNVHFLKPMTFMNNSGQSIAALMRRISLSLENILVVVDDMSLPFGQTRLRLSGSSGGHNGLKSIEKVLHSNQYARLRVGIDSPNRATTASAYVLSPFSPNERKQLSQVFW
jgi:PTH1 family peptidyl-tRNA hydrolase